MYTRCIYCSAALGSNDAVERFPVGRTLAFDAARGRLWAVCDACGRWNLAPFEERWEPIEEAERLFRDARLRAHSGNVGLARLCDGTRLIRVGAALAGEMVAWRYGERLRERRSRYLLGGAAVAGAAGLAVVAGVPTGGFGLAAGAYLWRTVLRPAINGYRAAEVVDTFPGFGDEAGARIHLRRRDLRRAALSAGEGGALELHLPRVAEEAPWLADGVLRRTAFRTLVLHDAQARRVMGRAMVAVNDRGARPRELERATQVLEAAGSAERYLAAAGRKRLRLYGGSEVYDANPLDPNPVAALALEMALHEETERAAMEGELGALEAMWRDAESIATIADRLAAEGS